MAGGPERWEEEREAYGGAKLSEAVGVSHKEHGL